MFMLIYILALQMILAKSSEVHSKHMVLKASRKPAERNCTDGVGEEVFAILSSMLTDMLLGAAEACAWW